MSIIDRIALALSECSVHESDGCSCFWQEGWIRQDQHCVEFRREIAEELVDWLGLTESYGFGDAWFAKRDQAIRFLGKIVGTTATGDPITLGVRYTTRTMPADAS